MRKVSQNAPKPTTFQLNWALELRLLEVERTPVLCILLTLDIDGDRWRVVDMTDVAELESPHRVLTSS